MRIVGAGGAAADAGVVADVRPSDGTRAATGGIIVVPTPPPPAAEVGDGAEPTGTAPDDAEETITTSDGAAVRVDILSGPPAPGPPLPLPELLDECSSSGWGAGGELFRAAPAQL